MLLMHGGQTALARMLRALAPLSLWALLLTLVLLFGLQGEQIMRQPLVIALLAVPILIQVCRSSTSSAARVDGMSGPPRPRMHDSREICNAALASLGHSSPRRSKLRALP
jgi:hypothetical protein